MRPLLIIGLTLSFLPGMGQTILHSKPEDRDFDRVGIHVITRKDNRLVVCKTVSFNTVASNGPLDFHSGPGGSIIETDIAVYDSLMEQVSETRLPLPKEIAGASFIVYDDFFYLFYQYLQGHTIYCMAEKVDLSGRPLAPAVCLDSTYNNNFNYRSQIYAIIHSEDKQKILVYKLNGDPVTGTIVSTVLFDSQLHELHRTTHGIEKDGAEYLSEFCLDNQGNLLFIGLSHPLSSDQPGKATLFTLKPAGDGLSYTTLFSGKVYTDDIHIFVDNTRGRYILSSLSSLEPQGNVEGLFVQIRDAAGTKPTKTIFTELTDSFRRTIRDHGNLRKVFNNYFLQGIHLLADGGFTIEAQELIKKPEGYYNRWNNLDLRVYRVGSSTLFYDDWEKDHSWPWNDWRVADIPGLFARNVSFSSEAGFVARFDATGMVQWMNKINLTQNDLRHNRLGYSSMLVDGRLYFIYNENIRNKHFLTGQCIDSLGNSNTDPRFREDAPLPGQSEDYFYYPRLAQQVTPGELIIPCQKGRQICLALLHL